MMLDFPNTPAPNDVFQRWRWDGQAWVATGGGGGAIDLADLISGDTGNIITIGSDGKLVAKGGGDHGVGNRDELLHHVITSSTTSFEMWWDFDRDYDMYEVIIYNLMFNAANNSENTFAMQFSVDGVTFVDANYDTISTINIHQSAAYIQKDAIELIGWSKNMVGSTNGPMEMHIKFSMPWLAGINKSFFWDAGWSSMPPASNPTNIIRASRMAMAGLNRVSTAPIKGLRFFSGPGGALLSGVFMLYGIGKPAGIDPESNAIEGTWVAVPAPTREWCDIAYGNGRFIVVAQELPGAGAIIEANDNVASWNAGSWSSQTSLLVGGKLRIAYGSGSNFYCVSADSVGAMLNSGGATWTAATGNAVQTRFNGIGFGNGRFVAVGGGLGLSGDPQTAWTASTLTWTVTTLTLQQSWNAVAFGGSTWVAVASTGTHRVMTSTDGSASWTLRLATSLSNWQSVTYGNGLFVALASGGIDSVMTSPDGITWTAREVPEKNVWRKVTFGGGLFVAVADTGVNRVMVSTDGINWRAQPAAMQVSWQSVTFGNGYFVAVAHNGLTDRIMSTSAAQILAAL